MREGDRNIDEARQGEAMIVDTLAFAVDNNSLAQKKLYLESYGCAMNSSDSEIIASIMNNVGSAVTWPRSLAN